MIKMTEGKQGSGKSYLGTKEIVRRAAQGFWVYTNMEIKREGTERVLRDRFRVRLPEWPIIYLDDERMKHFHQHVAMSVGRRQDKAVFLVIDECGNFFNSRDWKNVDNGLRMFLPQISKSGIDCLLLTQNAGQVDKSLREQCQTFTRARDMSQYAIPFLGKLDFFKFMFELELDYDLRTILRRRMEIYQSWVFECYDTSAFLDVQTKELASVLEQKQRQAVVKLSASDLRSENTPPILLDPPQHSEIEPSSARSPWASYKRLIFGK